MSGAVEVIIFPDVKRIARAWEEADLENRQLDSESVRAKCKARRDAKHPPVTITTGEK